MLDRQRKTLRQRFCHDASVAVVRLSLVAHEAGETAAHQFRRLVQFAASLVRPHMTSEDAMERHSITRTSGISALLWVSKPPQVDVVDPGNLERLGKCRLREAASARDWQLPHIEQDRHAGPA
jgi:hypothetical protein